MKLRKISQVEIDPHLTVSELLTRMKDGCGFTGKRLGQAADLLYDIHRDKDCTVFLGLAGALIPGGMRNVIGSLIDTGMIDAIVTTGANMTHDIIEAIEPSHFHGVVDTDDKELHEEDISRIYDTFMPQRAFNAFEEKIQQILEKIPRKTVLGTTELFIHIGKEIIDEKSILRKAYQRKILVPQL
jgi:deoxyhypusine synthase